MEASVRRADSLRLLPPPSKVRGLRSKKIRLSLRFTRDSAVPGGIPLGRIRLPYIKATQPVAIIEQPTPAWPPSESARINAAVQLQYIVAEDGRVSRETMRVLQADSPAFIDPSIQAILGSRFRPARSDTCPVKFLVRQRLVYRWR